MKNFLITAVSGVGLFALTVVGVLAATGRLNHEGSKGIPVVQGFFPAPEKGQETEAAVSEGTPDTDEPLLSRDGPLEVNTDPLFAKPLSKPVGYEEEPEDDPESARQPQDLEGSQHPRDGETPEDTEHRHEMEDLLGQGQYRAGGYFRFQSVESGISAEEINETWRRAREALADVEQRATVLDELESLLAVREQDLHDREAALAAEMKEIEQQQRKLDDRIMQFHEDVKMVRSSEVEPLKSVGQILASMEPETAGLVIQDWWKSEEGQDRAVKVLSVMDPDAANSIIGALPIQQVRDFLEKRLRLTREKSGGSP